MFTKTFQHVPDRANLCTKLHQHAPNRTKPDQMYRDKMYQTVLNRTKP